MKNYRGKVKIGNSISLILLFVTILIYIFGLLVDFNLPINIFKFENILLNWELNYIEDIVLSKSECNIYGEHYQSISLPQMTIKESFYLCYKRSNTNYLSLDISKDKDENDKCLMTDSIQNYFAINQCMIPNSHLILGNSEILLKISNRNFVTNLFIKDKFHNETNYSQIGQIQFIVNQKPFNELFIFGQNYIGFNQTCLKYNQVTKYYTLEKSFDHEKELISTIYQLILLGGILLFMLKSLVMKDIIHFNKITDKYMVFYVLFVFFLIFVFMIFIFHFFIKNLRLSTHMKNLIENQCFEISILNDFVKYNDFINENIYFCEMIILVCFFAILIVFYELKQFIIAIYKLNSNKSPNGYTELD